MRPVLTRALGVLAAAGLLATACTDGTATTSADGSGDTAAVSAYGYGPSDNAGVVYQPDVVVIPDGPRAIRAVSNDRMVWTLNGSAKGVSDLAPGRVMFASSDALGRVLRMDRHGPDVAITLAPVALTEVVSDAHLAIDQPVSVNALQFREVPDLPGAVAEDPVTTTATRPAAASRADSHLVAQQIHAKPAALVRRASTESADERSAAIGGWKVTAYRRTDALGLRGERTAANGGLKVDFDARIDVHDLHVVADVPISRGEVGTSRFEIDGITGLSLNITGGAGNGLADNRSVKLELPVTLTERLIVGGLPVTFTQKMKFLLQTAFTAKNGNLTAAGSWAVDGPLGFDGTTLTVPTMSERDSLVESIQGVSVGVNGLVFGVAFEFGLLVGLPVAGAGPVASFITSIGITNGSDLGIVKCRQSTLTSILTAGVGLSVYDPVKKALKKAWGIDIPAQKSLTTKTILKESWYEPKIVACRFSA